MVYVKKRGQPPAFIWNGTIQLFVDSFNGICLPIMPTSIQTGRDVSNRVLHITRGTTTGLMFFCNILAMSGYYGSTGYVYAFYSSEDTLVTDYTGYAQPYTWMDEQLFASVVGYPAVGGSPGNRLLFHRTSGNPLNFAWHNQRVTGDMHYFQLTE